MPHALSRPPCQSAATISVATVQEVQLGRTATQPSFQHARTPQQRKFSISSSLVSTRAVSPAKNTQNQLEKFQSAANRVNRAKARSLLECQCLPPPTALGEMGYFFQLSTICSEPPSLLEILGGPRKDMLALLHQPFRVVSNFP